jgi:hypothetical protein
MQKQRHCFVVLWLLMRRRLMSRSMTIVRHSMMALVLVLSLGSPMLPRLYLCSLFKRISILECFLQRTILKIKNH